MENELKINGLVNIDGMKFHDIEGGFGEGKKAMLVKEIANIHNRPFGKINELINNNIKRFKNNVDIVDLKGTEFAILLKDNEIYTQNSINASKNIYLLSERGYSKLLKILEDDIAWEQYDKLVDGYFSMREKLKKISPKQRLQLTILNGGELERIQALGEYTNLITEEATRPLLDKIEEDKPKVNRYENWINTNNSYTPSQMVKLFKDSDITSAKKLNDKLHELKFQYKQGKTWLPYVNIDKELYELKMNDYGSQLRWTARGIVKISEILNIELDKEQLEI